jgi:hypothetical protein
MRRPDDSSPGTATETTPQVRSAFLRGKTQCTWPAGFTPDLAHDDPLTQELSERLWTLAKPLLESGDEGLTRLSFQRAVDQAASDLFAHADVGIKPLGTAKHHLTNRFQEVEGACEQVAIEPPTEPTAEPTLVARLDATPPAPKTPGQARLCLSLGDVVLQLDLNVPSQSWLYQGYQRLREGIETSLERARHLRPPALLRRPGRLGMMTDDRELTIGLRHQRRPEDSGRTQRETTVSLRSRR